MAQSKTFDFDLSQNTQFASAPITLATEQTARVRFEQRNDAAILLSVTQNSVETFHPMEVTDGTWISSGFFNAADGFTAGDVLKIVCRPSTSGGRVKGILEVV